MICFRSKGEAYAASVSIADDSTSAAADAAADDDDADSSVLGDDVAVPKLARPDDDDTEARSFSLFIVQRTATTAKPTKAHNTLPLQDCIVEDR